MTERSSELLGLNRLVGSNGQYLSIRSAIAARKKRARSGDHALISTPGHCGGGAKARIITRPKLSTPPQCPNRLFTGVEERLTIMSQSHIDQMKRRSGLVHRAESLLLPPRMRER